MILSKIKNVDPYKNVLLPIKIDLAKFYTKQKKFTLDLILVFFTILSIFFPKQTNKFLLKKYIEKYDSGINDRIISIIK